jgi:hypothetical protein
MRGRASLLFSAGAALGSLVHCGSFGESTPALPPDSGSPSGAESGAPDAGADVHVAAFGGCAPALADDFERMPLGQGPWGVDPAINGGAVMASDPAMPFRGMRSLRIDVPAPVSGAYFERDLAARSRVRLAFALRSAGPQTRTILVNSIQLSAGPLMVPLSLYFALDTGVMELREQRFDSGGNPNEPHKLGPVDDKWRRYALTLDMTAKAHARVEIDDVTVFDADLKYPFAPGPVQVRGGLAYAESGTATAVWLDDVVICSEP